MLVLKIFCKDPKSLEVMTQNKNGSGGRKTCEFGKAGWEVN